MSIEIQTGYGYITTHHVTGMTAKRLHKFTSALERSENKLWGAHFAVPANVVKSLSKAKERRVVCRLNGETTYQCALLPHGGGTFVVTVNKKIRDGLSLRFGDQLGVELTPDDSAYGLPMPEEFSELLRQDKEGSKVFHALTRGKQRVLLYIIGKPKDADKRIFRAIVILRHIKAGKGAIDHKKLGRELKDQYGEPRQARKGLLSLVNIVVDEAHKIEDEG